MTKIQKATGLPPYHPKQLARGGNQVLSTSPLATVAAIAGESSKSLYHSCSTIGESDVDMTAADIT